MLKIFIKSVIAVTLCANTLYADEYLPSTSPDIKVLKSEQKLYKVQKLNNKDVITFSEFPNGTKITDQYADRGIIFKGDSPFITSDGSNPTSPVLSGTPRFDGAMEGHFVDPVTHEPTTVNHFELDGGYFNQISSTVLKWFNKDGELIRQVRDSKLGIEHFSKDDEGIAYFRIEIVSQEDAGYAIDNVSFEIKDISLDKITHKAGSPIANTFTIYLKSSNKGLEGICDYKFFVEDANQKLEGTGCKVNSAKNASKVDFTITESPYNIEDAKVTMCNKDNECKEITDIKNFSVYGTNFDVTKDAFSFYNGEWNNYMFVNDSFLCWVNNSCSKEQEEYMESFRNLVNSFKTFIPFLREGGLEKDLIGYYDNENNKNNKQGRKFGGVCHGLAFASIANYNNKKPTWGDTLASTKTQKEIENIFQSHWDNIDTEGSKAFARTPHSYDAVNDPEDAFHALGKIAFYFITQESYYDLIGSEAWVGTYNKHTFATWNEVANFYKKSLKKSLISNFIFQLDNNSFLGRAGGHSILVAELIEYNTNNKSNLILLTHDNNFVDTFSMLDFYNSDFFVFESKYAEKHDKEQKEEYRKWLKTENKDKYKISEYDSSSDFINVNPYLGTTSYSKFGYYSSSDDKLSIYGKLNNQQKMYKRIKVQKQNNANQTFDYLYPNHTSITIVGGKLLKITNTQTQKEVVLNPIINELEENKAYLQDDMILTEFLLPKNAIYKIELQKYKQYPAFEVYAKIPTDDGKVEIINYENLATNKNDTTLAYFLVGSGNTEKAIKREGESDVVATYDEAIDMKITPATFVKAVALSSGVKLSWNLPDNPNLQEVVIVRKENSKPTSMSDGSEVYRGMDETFIDSSAYNNRKYYYGIYTVAKNGDVAEGQFIFVNTHQATLFGYVKDSQGNPVKNAEIILKNGIGLVKKEIIRETTDKNGYFSFANIPLGTYLLEFSHSNYTFTNNKMTVELNNKNMEVSQEAIGQPMIAMNANSVMKVDESETISWDGLNIIDSATVNIKLKRANNWETLASGVKFSKHHINWKVTEPKDENAILKIELASDSTIYSEEKIYIFGSDKTKYDFDGDGDIDIDDIMKVVKGWNTNRGDAKYDSTYDFNKDDNIDIKDVMMIASKWDKL